MNTPSVASCARCGSLAWRCPERACRGWNRSFVNWCRRCGRDLRKVPDVWDDLRRSEPVDGPAAIGPAQVVADLAMLDGPTGSRCHRVALAAIQGFLALHQAGGFVALVRPFAPVGSDPALGLREPESPLPAVPAYDPSLLPGGRRMVLADRREASIIDLWDTELSAAYPLGQKHRKLAPPAPIAAAPVLLGESKVGLVLGEAPPYLWLVWDFLDAASFSPTARTGMRPMEMIEGGPCEVTVVTGGVLTLATPAGHWAWRLADAEAGRVEAIRRTWPNGPESNGVRVEVGRRAVNPEAFARPAQVFHWDEPGGPFSWHFRTDDGRARSYRIVPEGLATDDRFDYDETAPVGLARRPGQARPSMIFDKRDQLYEERGIRGQLAPCQVSLPGEGGGLQLAGTLIVTIGKGAGGARQVVLQSLWGSHPPVSTEAIVGLSSDPFIWAGHLFTIERPTDGRLALVRRALIPSSEVPR